MSSWSMDDGSDLTGTYTFTNASAIVQGNSSADTTEIKVGDIVIDDNGDKVRVANIQPNRTVATSNVDTSANTIEITDHGFVANQEVVYQANGGTAITGLTDDTIFFVKAVSSANAVTLSATEGGSVISLTGTGNNAQSFSGTSTKAFTATNTFTPSTNSGSACTVTRPPINGSGKTTTSAGTTTAVIDDNVLGITSGESLGGVDNVTAINVGNTSLGGLTTIGGNTYTSAPSVTVAAPTARTITQANINETTNVFTVTGHNMRTGTKLTYTSNGTNIVHSGGTLADATAVFVIRVDEDTFKIASSLANALAGTALDITNDGNDSNSFVGDTATATATVSGGKVTGVTVTAVGSDYQSAPTVTVAAANGTGSLNLASGSVLIAADDEIVVSSGFYGVIATGEAVTYSDGGGTAPTGLVDTTVYFLIKSGTANRISLASTYANAVAGTKITLAAGSVAGSAHTFTGGTATATANLGLGVDGDNDSREIAHVGWVKKTVGTGGRAGRVHYETLVAASSISGDAEDIATPDS